MQSMKLNLDQETSEEYVKRVGIEYRYGCLKENNPESCHLLGDYYEAIEKRMFDAKELYRKNCIDRNYAHSCYKYGAYFMRPQWKEFAKDYNLDEAEKWMKKACEGGVLRGCDSLGILYNSATPTREPDIPNCIKTWDKCCREGNGQCCFNLASAHLNIKKKEEKPDDLLLSARLKRREEERLNPASNLDNPIPATDKSKIPTDYAKAFEYSKIGCDEHYHWQCCINASLLFRKGLGVDRNMEKFKEYRSKAKDIVELAQRNEQQPFTGSGA